MEVDDALISVEYIKRFRFLRFRLTNTVNFEQKCVFLDLDLQIQ